MSEEKKGHLKITFDLEVNEPLMEVMKDSMAKMPMMMKHGNMWMKGEEEKKM